MSTISVTRAVSPPGRHDKRRRDDVGGSPTKVPYSLGDSHGDAILTLIDDQVGINPEHAVAYVGNYRGSFAPLLESKFALRKPVKRVHLGVQSAAIPLRRSLPASAVYPNTQTDFTVVAGASPVKSSGNFLSDAGKAVPYDRVVFYDALGSVENTGSMFDHVANMLAKDGRVVIIHRPVGLCSLPLPTAGYKLPQETTVSSNRLTEELRANGFVKVTCEVRTVPVRIEKHRYLAMMREGFPPPMDRVKGRDLARGVRELDTRIREDLLEFRDRLVVISACAGRPSLWKKFDHRANYNQGPTDLFGHF
ncbi:Hypp3017 [Branchiostoma lanceolatum]|uniref:Hypp3017 protein n=1 Tax=Branchiostoma lanceolatum TaxID=7740 RepID=A0A8J9ZYD1_BRALA|nr:Hypp3017 [Branchiostoma lanceolatum]